MSSLFRLNRRLLATSIMPTVRRQTEYGGDTFALITVIYHSAGSPFNAYTKTIWGYFGAILQRFGVNNVVSVAKSAEVE